MTGTKHLQAIGRRPNTTFALLFLALLCTAPMAAAVTNVDGFEDDTVNAAPTSSFYTAATIGLVKTTVAYEGTQAVRLANTGAVTFPDSFCNTGQSVSFRVLLGSISTSTNTDRYIGVSFTSGMTGSSLTTGGMLLGGIKFGSGGVVEAYRIGANSLAHYPFSTPYVANTWYTVTMGNFQCQTPQVGASGDITFNGETISLPPYGYSFWSHPDNTAMRRLVTGNTATSPSPIGTYIDMLGNSLPSPPSAPLGSAVANGPGDDALTLTWQPPADPGTSPITKYRVYGGDSPGGEAWLADKAPSESSFQESALGYSRTRYYKVSAVNAVGESPLSAETFGTTLSPGRMTIASPPQCSQNAPLDSQQRCNSTLYGYTTDIAGAGTPQFTIDWGDFNGHSHIRHEGTTPTFWMEMDLSVDSPNPSYQSYDGQTVPVAQLQRLDGTAWTDLPDGMISGVMHAPAIGPWTLSLPTRLQLTAADLDTDDATTFRLAPANRPDTSLPWTLTLRAAQSELVAPPVIMVHGWDPSPSKPDYAQPAGWGDKMEGRLISRSAFVYGQSPWAWSNDGAIRNMEFDGKSDFRIASFALLDRTVELRQNPTGSSGDGIQYDGPVNILAHSLGGLVSRYFVEDVIDDLHALNHGIIDPADSRPMTAVEAQLNAHNGLNVSLPGELVSSIVMMATPHLGSGWAQQYISQVNGAQALTNCIRPFYRFSASEGCMKPYYSTKRGDWLIQYRPLPTPKNWWDDSIGAYRDPLRGPFTSMMADFELLRMEDGNPVLHDLDLGFGAPAGVDYFLMAGGVFDGDTIVSEKSATHGYDSNQCYRVIYEGGYAEQIPILPDHWSLPAAPVVQDDSLAFMAGDKSVLCQTAGQEAGGASAPLAASVLSPSESMETPSVGRQPEPYRPPLSITLAVDGEGEGSVYSMRLDWQAPGSADGTLGLLATNGTLPGSTLTLRSPSGQTATLAGGNVTWATWTGSRAVDADHLLAVQMPTAAAGAWSLWMNRTSQWPGFLIPTLTFDTALSITAETDDHGVVGEPVTYRIHVSDDGSPVAAAAVTLDYPDPALNSTSTMVLLDNGMAPDAQAGDGIYSGQHVFLENGSFPYHATATFAGTELFVDGSTPVLDEEPEAPAWPPSEPLAVSAVRGPGGGEITLSWQAPLEDGGANVAGYRIYRGSRGGSEVPLTVVGNVLTYTDASLGNEETAYYRVAAVNRIGYSALSEEVAASTYSLPTAPRSFAASAGARGTIHLTWQEPLADGGSSVTTYTIYRGDAAGSETAVANLGNVLEYLDTGLDDNATLYYRVSAGNVAGEGPKSSEVSAATIAWVAGAPRNLAAVPGPSAGDITLNWEGPVRDGGDAVTGYNVYRNGSLLTSVSSVLSYVDGGLGNGATWSYQVSAVNHIGEGARSNNSTTATFRPPGVPVALSATGGLHEVALRWREPADDGGSQVTGYNVYLLTGESASLLASADETEYLDAGLGNGIERRYLVRAFNAAGEGEAAAADATTFDVPSAPQNVSAEPGVSRITLTWVAAADDGGTGVTNYTVYAGESVSSLTVVAKLGNVTEYTEHDLSNGVMRHYAVTASNRVGEGPRSSTVNATTRDVPTAPPSLNATAGIGNVSLRWEAPEGSGGTPVTSYRIYRGNQTGMESVYATVDDVLSYTDHNATPGTRYYYQVSAVNAAGEGARSPEASVRPSSLLLAIPGLPLPPAGVPPISVAIVRICDSGSELGCAAPGTGFLCVEVEPAGQPALTLACLDHAQVPPDVDSALHRLSPVTVGVPAGLITATPELLVTYWHESGLMQPIAGVCLPVSPSGLGWYLANGNETGLAITLKPSGPLGGTWSDPVLIPWLGQIVAARDTGGQRCA